MIDMHMSSIPERSKSFFPFNKMALMKKIRVSVTAVLKSKMANYNLIFSLLLGSFSLFYEDETGRQRERNPRKKNTEKQTK